MSAHKTAIAARIHLAGIVALLIPLATAAEVIRVDLQPNAPFSGRAAVNFTGVESQAAAASPLFGSDGSNTWNYLSIAPGVIVNNPSFPNLVDSTGAATTVGFSITGAVFAADDVPIDNIGSDAVENDYFAIGATPVNFTISGLPPNTQVTLYSYAPNFVLYDSGNPVGQPSRGYTLIANGTTIVVPSGPKDNALGVVTTDASGNISGTWETAGNEGDWSGFQLAYSPPPTIGVGGLVNNFSFTLAGLPNYGIAEGSIFDIFGTNLATTTSSQGVPLQTSLAGTSVSVTVGGVTTQALPVFVSPFEIAAILRSGTPVGTGTITAASGGVTSAPAPIQVLESAFGLLTVSESGTGAAAAYDYNEGHQLLTQNNSANPGEYVVLWGSGLGPVTGDETIFQTPANLSNIPIEVDIGGVSATVSYHGRSTFPGLDQINVIVPAGVSGCSVSVVVSANGVPSNFSTIPIAATGRTCSDPATSPFSTTEWQTLSSLSTVNLGVLSLGNITTNVSSTLGTSEDFAYGEFASYTPGQLIENGFGVSSVGSCLVSTSSANRASGIVSGTSTIGFNTSTPLNAGPQINLTGPDGTLVLPFSNGGYFEPVSGNPAQIIPPGGGTFTFNNGAGGTNVGAFTTTLTESESTPLSWTNATGITSVNRSQGVTVQWTGGASGTFVQITGFSSTTTATNTVSATFTCTAPLSAGQFTVPAPVLESLPASETGSLSLSGVAIPQTFAAPGLDQGLALFFETVAQPVPYI